MAHASQDLLKPLGTASPAAGGRTGWATVSAVCVGAIAAAAIGYAALFGDRLGGRPWVRTEIATLPDRPAAEPPATAPRIPARRSGEEIETASGVIVTRPPGTSAPEALIVRVPDAPAEVLRPAPDPSLSERTRYGILPKVGPDGARALDAYARPPGTLPGDTRPAGRIALVVGGLGIGQAATRDATQRLPAAVTLAFAPYGNDLDRMAAAARSAGHEIMLQVPMEPFDYPDSDPGPHTLIASARPAENLEHLRWAMGRIAGYVGIVNYMGGKLTADEKALGPILREAGERGLGFLDDGSSSRSVVTGVKSPAPAVRASLVVDAVARADQIDRALEKLETEARSGAVAVGTATALPLSLERIERWAKGLEARGILLVPASGVLRAAQREGEGR